MGVLAKFFTLPPPPDYSAAAKVAREAARKEQLVVAVAGMTMRGVRQIDDDRRTEANGDPTLNAIMARVEAVGIAQLESIQRNVLPEPWAMTSNDLRP
jgi:hypothetical protein